LVAIGGSLSTERLLQAYTMGLFPWFEEEGIPFWFSPDPRCVLYPANLKVSKSMQSLFRQQAFLVTTNQAFEDVIAACAETPRPGQDDTWISDAFIHAYGEFHKAGYAQSVEVWDHTGTLVGGLYGVRIGNIFFGESMFSRMSNASKYGFIHYVRDLERSGVVLIDCQQATPHLISLGAVNIARQTFLDSIAHLRS
jgi:leucyl/phenylalanyl-tRNA---protein transferase